VETLTAGAEALAGLVAVLARLPHVVAAAAVVALVDGAFAVLPCCQDRSSAELRRGGISPDLGLSLTIPRQSSFAAQVPYRPRSRH
jgi:hypothetical protein